MAREVSVAWNALDQGKMKRREVPTDCCALGFDREGSWALRHNGAPH